MRRRPPTRTGTLRPDLIPLGIILLLATAAVAEPPSFDCLETGGAATALVCRDQDLSGLDREVERLFQLAQDANHLSEAGRAEIVQRQHLWLRQRDACEKSADLARCMLDSYVQRIHALRRDHAASRSRDEEGISKGPMVMTCNGLESPVSLTFVDSDTPHAYLQWSDRHLVATLAPAASGSKYMAHETDGDYVFWIKRDTALFEWPGEPALDCAIQASN